MSRPALLRMSRPALRPSHAISALSVGFIVVIAALVVSGLLSTTTRTFTIRDPNFSPTVGVPAGHAACEAPITSDGAARGVEIFGKAVRGDPRVVVEVHSLNRRVSASGLIHDPRASSEQDVRLNRPIPGGVPVRVCIRSLSGAYELKGSGAVDPQIHATGVADGTQFSLLLTRSQTLFSSLPTAFARASIFRPDWVGPWLFWLLLALLAAAFVTAGIGIRTASDADRREPATEHDRAPRDSS